MATSWRTVRVFISSTFRDMHEERDHLVTVVFPELRERIERLGLDFYDVDLRWGVPQTGVDGEQANSWAYCKQWIDRVEPFFVCILGQRYGWTPPANEIRDEAERRVFAGMSITEMEIRHAVLTGRLRRRSFFYFRNTRVPARAPAKIRKEFVDVADEGRLNALKDKITQESGRPVRPYACRWTGTGFDAMEAFGQAVLEDLWSGVLRDERYVPKEAWRKALGRDPDGDLLYTDESQPLPREVWEKIVEHARPAPRDPLDAEAEAMAAFAASRLRGFEGRQRELDDLADFVGDLPPDASRLCVVRAVPGQGKSALLARFTGDMTQSAVGRQQSAVLISHFVGATEHSADPRLLVDRLIKELDRNGIPKPEGEEEKEDLDSLARRLAARLGDYAGERRIVLILDAVNQLTSGHDLFWLPHSLGPNVRVILSCVADPSAAPDSPDARVLAALANRRPEPRWVDLRPLDEADVRQIVVSYLREYCKELDREPIETICQMEQARNPLYLLVMLNELRTLGGNDMNRIVPQLIAEMQRRHPDAVGLFGWVLERLEVFGREPVRLWCSYLASGRTGMASRELSDLLVRRLGPESARMALLIERGLRRYLQRRGPQLDFFHSQLRQAVAQRYLKQESDRIQAHGDIAAYFRDKADPAGEGQWTGDYPRGFSELPHHLAQARESDTLRQVLTNFAFLQGKLGHFGPQALIDDYELALNALEDQGDAAAKQWGQSLKLLQGAVRLSAHVLAQDPSQLPSQLTGRLLGHECPEVRDLLDQILPRYRKPWLRPVHATLTPPGGPLLRTLEGHTSLVMSVALTGDGRRAVSGSLDKTLKVWDVETGALLRTLEGHAGEVNSVALTGDGRRAVSGSGSFMSAEKTLKVWDLETGALLRTLDGHADHVLSVALTADGRRAVSGSHDKTLKVWDMETGALLRTLEGHADRVSSVALAADGRRAVSGSYDKTLKVWDLETGALLRTLQGHTSLVMSVALTGDGRRAVSGSHDKTLKVWDLETGALLRTLEGHTNPVLSVALTADGRRAVSGSHDKTLKVWDLETGQLLRTLEGHTNSVLSAALTADGRRAVSGSEDKTLKVWDLETGQVLHTLEGHANSSGVSSVALTGDGHRAVSGSEDTTLKVRDVETCQVLRTLRGHARVVWSVALTGDGRRAVSGSGDKTLKVWDVETGQLLRTLEGHRDSVRSLALTADGRRAISGSDDKTVKVWDLETGALLRTLEGHANWVMSVALTGNGRRAVSGSDDKTLKVWDLETGTLLRTLDGHTSMITSVALTADGRRAVSGAEDKTLKVWDLETGALQRTLEGHRGRVNSVALTVDGRRAVSGSYDKTLKVWDLGTGEIVATFTGESTVRAVAMARDGRTIVAGEQSGRVHFLRLEGLPGPSPLAERIVRPGVSPSRGGIRAWLASILRRRRG